MKAILLILGLFKGNHGSRALWQQFEDSQQYWKAVSNFLNNNIL